MPYLDRVEHFDDPGVSKCPQLLNRVLGEGQRGTIGSDVEREDAAVGTVLLHHDISTGVLYSADRNRDRR